MVCAQVYMGVGYAQRGGMRTLHVGRFPLTGASLLAMYRFRPDGYLSPPGIRNVYGKKNA